MGVIFTASADSLSAVRGSRYLAPILRWLFPGISEPALDRLIFCIRKCAHVGEYAVLAVLVWLALRGAGRIAPKGWVNRHAITAMAIVVLYAATDELHQTIVPTRIGTPVDVLIDTAGGLLGLGVVWILGKFFRKW
jgi:VanZ family protein